MNKQSVIGVIIFVVIIGVIIILGSIHGDNTKAEYVKNTALVDGVVIGIHHSSWSGTIAIVETEDKRYSVKCELCLEGDKVQLETHSNRYAFLEKIYGDT